MLVRKSLPFRLLALDVDPNGRYVIIHAYIMNLELVIVGLYIPPPRFNILPVPVGLKNFTICH